MSEPGFWSVQNIIILVLVLAAMIGVGFVMVRIFSGGTDKGKEVAKTIHENKNILLEILIVYLCFVEAFIPASLSSEQEMHMSFAPRLAAHTAISGIGIVSGFGIFFQVEEAVKTREKYKDYLDNPHAKSSTVEQIKRRIRKQWSDVWWSTGISMASPLVNLFGLAWLLDEVQNLHWRGVMDMSFTLFFSTAIVVLHLVILFYISKTSADSFMDDIKIPESSKNITWDNARAYFAKAFGVDFAAIDNAVKSSSNDKVIVKNKVMREARNAFELRNLYEDLDIPESDLDKAVKEVADIHARVKALLQLP